MERFLNWLSTHLKCAVDPDPFFDTYFIFPGVVLHKFVAPDPSPGFHTHPWAFSISIMLTGGYREIIFSPTGSHTARDRPAGSIRAWGPNFAHQLTGIPGKPFGGWSLFITGPVLDRVYNWGYWHAVCDKAGRLLGWEWQAMYYPKKLNLSSLGRGKDRAKNLPDLCDTTL